MIHAELEIYEVNSWLVGRLPDDASEQLQSRSQVMINGRINDHTFQRPLEPDGQGSHWLHVDSELAKELKIKNGDKITFEFEASKEWPEPTLPKDFSSMLKTDTVAKTTWDKATPMAHWEWLRWVNSTTNPGTRAKRIEVSRSKLNRGMRRPCFFNRSMCCIPEVSKSGVLIRE